MYGEVTAEVTTIHTFVAVCSGEPLVVDVVVAEHDSWMDEELSALGSIRRDGPRRVRRFRCEGHTNNLQL